MPPADAELSSPRLGRSLALPAIVRLGACPNI
jgi:hypothetical protein